MFSGSIEETQLINSVKDTAVSNSRMPGNKPNPKIHHNNQICNHHQSDIYHLAAYNRCNYQKPQQY